MKNSAAGKVFWFVLAVRLLLAGVVSGLPADSTNQKTVGFQPPKLAQQYGFVKYGLNKIEAKDSLAMTTFYNALHALQNGTRRKVNIVHIGDSHIQADIFSGRMRTLLQETDAFENGGRGFVFPYPLARTNNPWNYKVTSTGIWSGCKNVQYAQNCNWGLAGITAETSDSSATFSIQNNSVPVSKVRIFYPVKDLTQFSVSLKASDIIYQPVRTDTLGFAEFILSAEVTEVQVLLQKTFTRQKHFTLQGISLENERPGLVYSSLGVNGAEVVSFLRSNVAFENNLAALNPDLIIISLGTNDAYGKNFNPETFKQNYGTLIQRIKKAAPQASVLFTTPGDNYRHRKYPNYSNVKATAKLYELAEETGCAVWNFYHVMGGLRSVVKWQLNGLAAKDKVHLTGKGYRLQGDLLFDAMMNDYLNFSKKAGI
ncbi:GDSL-type esterase/lipase family protein [Adhaeribacter terreus]|uniref:GDSL-type esterase/lipase family protein n=1 Tax=Adhaeribacter terreus TaxID=529703 RepID=A0ABW0EB63_9BACT